MLSCSRVKRLVINLIRTSSKLILFAICIVSFIYLFDNLMVHPVLPIYAKSIGATVFMVGLIMGVYSVTNCIGNITWGRLSDVKGRRLPLVIGFLVSGVVVLLYSTTFKPADLLVLRLIHGFFSGALGPCTLTLMTDLAPPERRGTYMGVYGASISLSATISPALAGILSTKYGPSAVWLTIFIAFLTAALIIVTLIPETHRKVHKDFRESLNSTSTLKISIRSILKRRNVVISIWGIFAWYWVLGTIVTLFTLYLSNLYETGFISVDPRMAFGMLMSIYGIAVLFLNYPMGRISDIIGRKIPLICGYIMVSVGLFLLTVNSIAVMVVAWIALLAISHALVWPSITALLMDELLPFERGIGAGFFELFLTLGTAIGMPIMGLLGGMLGFACGIRFAAILPISALLLSLFIVPKPKVEAKVSLKIKISTIVIIVALLATSYLYIMFLSPKH